MAHNFPYSSGKLDHVLAKAVVEILKNEKRLLYCIPERGLTEVCPRPHAIHHLFVSAQFAHQYNKELKDKLLSTLTTEIYISRHLTANVTTIHQYGGTNLWYLKVEFFSCDVVDEEAITLPIFMQILQQRIP